MYTTFLYIKKTTAAADDGYRSRLDSSMLTRRLSVRCDESPGQATMDSALANRFIHTMSKLPYVQYTI